MKRTLFFVMTVLIAIQCSPIHGSYAQPVMYGEDIRSAADALENEGWRTLDANSSIAEQLYNTRTKKYEIDSVTGSRKYILSSMEVEYDNFIVCQSVAENYCYADIAGQLNSWVLSESAQQLEIKEESAGMRKSIASYLEKRTSYAVQKLNGLSPTQVLIKEREGMCVLRMTVACEVAPLLEQLRDEAVGELRNAMQGWSREYENLLFGVFNDAQKHNQEGTCVQYDEECRKKAAELENKGWHSLDVPIADQLSDTKCKKTAVDSMTNNLLYVTATAVVSDKSFVVAQALADNQCKSEIATQINSWVMSEAVTQLKDRGVNPEIQDELREFFSKSTSMVAQQIRRLYRTLQMYKREGDIYTLQMTMAYELSPLIDQFRDAAISELRKVKGWTMEYEDLMYSVFSGAKSYSRKK